MSTVATKQYLIVKRGNVDLFTYFETHATVKSVVDFAKHVLELTTDCELRTTESVKLEMEKTFEELKITATGSVVLLVAKTENGDWEDLPLHNPEPAKVDEQAVQVIKEQKNAKDKTTVTSSSEPSSSSSC